MVVQRIQRTLYDKSRRHREELQRLGKQVEDVPLSQNVLILPQRPQVSGMNTIIQNPLTDDEDFVFYFDRMAILLIEKHATPHLLVQVGRGS
jgi:uridine kinase